MRFGNRDRSLDFGKIDSLGGGTAVLNIHVFFKLLRAEQPKQKELRTAKTPANPEEHRSWERPPCNREVGTGREPGQYRLREPGRSRQRKLLRRAGEQALTGTRILYRHLRAQNGTQIHALQLRTNCNLTARIQNSQSPMGSSPVERRRSQPLILPESCPGRQQQLWNRHQAS